MGILRTNEISGLETPTAVTGSVVFDGDGDYLTLASSEDFAYGTYDFTWEGFIYASSIPSNAYLLDHGSNGGAIEMSSSGVLKYYNSATGTGSSLYTTGFGTISINTWYHFAACRKNGTTYLFLNGALTTSASDTKDYSALALSIGRYGSATDQYWNGYISNFRILKGTALYTSDFTPPVHELQPIGDTVLLCCNNPDSAGAEATGKTITVNGDAVASTFSPGLTRDFTYGTQFDGVSRFDTQGYFVPPSGTTEQRGRGRGLFGGGNNPAVNTIFYVDIATQGNAQEFGDLTIDSGWGRLGCSSATRGLFAGGYVNTPAATFYNVIQYVTIATTGNSNDFGDLNNTVYKPLTCSSSTRGLFAGGYVGPAFPTFTNVIDYVTIAALGNATDFGDLISTAQRNNTGFSSPTRGIFGQTNISPTTNGIEFVTIATTGNAQDFGDTTTTTRNNIAGASSSVRGVFAGGDTPALFNTIDYVTIATTGNAQDFGDLIEARAAAAGASNSIRAVIAGGINPSNSNTIEFITFTSTGNAQDFGDLISARRDSGGCSDSHGGLS